MQTWLRKNENCPLRRQHVFTFVNKPLSVAPGMIQIPNLPLHVVILSLVMEISSHIFNKLNGMLVRGIRVLQARLCLMVYRIILWLDTGARTACRAYEIVDLYQRFN